MNAERKFIDEHSSNGGRRSKRRKSRRTRRAFLVRNSKYQRWRVRGVEECRTDGPSWACDLQLRVQHGGRWHLQVRSRALLCLCWHVQRLRPLLRASVLHPLYFFSCAITPCLPASPSPSSKWDVKGSFVGKIPGKCCKARHPRGNHLKSPRQVCQLIWSYHVRCRLGLK